MKLTSLIIMAILSSAICFAQNDAVENYSHEFGKVTQYEMSMTQYPADADAEAIVIHELGDFHFIGEYDKGFMLNMYFTIKIKILKQAGLRYADFEIPFYIGNQKMEIVDMIEGHTFNFIDGKLTKTPLDLSKIYQEKKNDNWHIKKFAMPDVREGSVIELKYHIKTPYFVNIREWEFQKRIPVVHSLLTYKAIPYYEYTYLVKGATKFDIFKSEADVFEKRFGKLVYKELAYKFGFNKLPAFKDEEFITSPNDYMVGMIFQLSAINYPTGGREAIMSTWPEINKELLKNKYFGKYIADCKKQGEKILPTLNLSDKSLEQKVKIISEYVANNYKHNGFIDKFTSQSVKDFMKNKVGNAAEINLFLTGLLQSAGLEIAPVAISTRRNGAISKNHPFEQHLNYVIAMVKSDSISYFLDATNPLLSYNELPEECINVLGLVVNKEKTENWVFVEQNIAVKTIHTFSTAIFPDKNMMNVKANFESFGNDAYRYRKAYKENPSKFSEYIQKQTNLVLLNDAEVNNADDLEKPFGFSFDFNTSIENPGDKLFIHPFAGLVIQNNPFKQTERKFAVDMIYLKGNKYIAHIEIPSGYRIEHLPESLNVERRIVNINYSASVVDNKIIVEASYDYTTNMYAAKDYPQLKLFTNEIIKKFNEMIVLVKE